MEDVYRPILSAFEAQNRGNIYTIPTVMMIEEEEKDDAYGDDDDDNERSGTTRGGRFATRRGQFLEARQPIQSTLSTQCVKNQDNSTLKSIRLQLVVETDSTWNRGALTSKPSPRSPVMTLTMMMMTMMIMCC